MCIRDRATSSSLLESSIAGASRVLFSIAGGPDLTLTEVSEAARTVEACADENATVSYTHLASSRTRACTTSPMVPRC